MNCPLCECSCRGADSVWFVDSMSVECWFSTTPLLRRPSKLPPRRVEVDVDMRPWGSAGYIVVAPSHRSTQKHRVSKWGEAASMLCVYPYQRWRCGGSAPPAHGSASTSTA
jgi:hypothetical protein